MSGSEEPERHITEAEYREWLERTRPRLADELPSGNMVHVRPGCRC